MRLLRWILGKGNVVALSIQVDAQAREIAELRDELLTGRHDAVKTQDAHVSEVRRLETEVASLESQLTVRKLEVAELSAVIARFHAITERDTAIAAAATQAANRGELGRPQNARVLYPAQPQ